MRKFQSVSTHDILSNGRSGYHAPYYLSPEKGIIYNRQIIDGIIPAIQTGYNRKPLQNIPFALIERSLRTPHSKIWIFNNTEVFNNAPDYTLNPSRWVKFNTTLGRKSPLPDFPKIDLQGSFIDPCTDDYFIDELKLERRCDLHRKGFL
jgi:hypothetical protein